MKNIFFGLLTFVLLCSACQRKQMQVNGVTLTSISVDSTFDSLSDSAYNRYLQPIKVNLDSQMNRSIGFTPEGLIKDKPESTLSNWAADALREAASEYSEKKVDMAVINMGGLRCDIEPGEIPLRKVYELMPFDNRMVVVTLQGKDVAALCANFARKGGEGVSGLRFRITPDNTAETITVNGKNLDLERMYTIATSDYLAAGNDGMEPMLTGTIQQTNIKVREVFLQKIQVQTAAGKSIVACKDGRIQYK